MAREETTKSVLIKLLQQVSHGVTQRIGLVPGPEAKVPAMALLVSLEQADVAGVAAATVAGADAIALPAKQAAAKWADLTKAASGKPVGIMLPGNAAMDSEELKQIVDRAPDFVLAGGGRRSRPRRGLGG